MTTSRIVSAKAKRVAREVTRDLAVGSLHECEGLGSGDLYVAGSGMNNSGDYIRFDRLARKYRIMRSVTAVIGISKGRVVVNAVVFAGDVWRASDIFTLTLIKDNDSMSVQQWLELAIQSVMDYASMMLKRFSIMQAEARKAKALIERLLNDNSESTGF